MAGASSDDTSNDITSNETIAPVVDPGPCNLLLSCVRASDLGNSKRLVNDRQSTFSRLCAEQMLAFMQPVNLHVSVSHALSLILEGCHTEYCGIIQPARSSAMSWEKYRRR